MSILINGMVMPTFEQGVRTINIYADGVVTNYAEETIGKAVPVPPHGDLIDRDEIKWIEEEFEERCHNDRWAVVEKIAYKPQVDKLPTIIPAEEGE